jgi:predicted translin family RNA/ssDNA-binding protein
MQGILTDYFWESTRLTSLRKISFETVNQTTVEMLETLRLMCDELQKYLEVVPNVVQKQLLLCETAEAMVKSTPCNDMTESAKTADAIKDVLGHVVSS